MYHIVGNFNYQKLLNITKSFKNINLKVSYSVVKITELFKFLIPINFILENLNLQKFPAMK